MNAADIAILVVIGLSMLFGLVRGFVGELLSLICWVAAFWVAWAFGANVAAFYGNWLHEPAARIVAGYVTCFLGVVIVGALIGTGVRRLLNRGGLRGEDRMLGMAFGLARGLLLVTFAVLMLGFTAAPRETRWWHTSMLLPPFENGAAWVAQKLPPDVIRHLQTGGRSLPALSAATISTLREAPASTARPAGATTTGPASTSSAAHNRRRGDVGQ